jgi:hypothetical protein
MNPSAVFLIIVLMLGMMTEDLGKSQIGPPPVTGAAKI